MDFSGSSDDKASAYNAGDLGLIPGSGRSPGEGNGNPLQYSCLENPMDRGPWGATIHGVAKSQTQLSNFSVCVCPFLNELPCKILLLTSTCISTTRNVSHDQLWPHSSPKVSVSESRSVVSDSLWPRGQYSPWNSPGQNIGVCSPFPFPGDLPVLQDSEFILTIYGYSLENGILLGKRK